MSDLGKQIIEANIELHRKEASFYDLVTPEIFNAHEQVLTQRVLTQALKSISAPLIRALDIGSGTGNISLKLAAHERVALVTGVDLSAEMLAQQRAKWRGTDSQKITLVTQDIDSYLSQHDNQYDLITISSVLHHLPDYMATLDVLMRRLAPGGVICIFHEPTGVRSFVLRALEWWDSRLYVNLFLPKDIKRQAKELDYSLSDYHVFNGFKLKEIRQHFKEKGFTELFFKRHTVAKMAFIRALGALWPEKNNFILSVRKEI